MNRKGAPFHCTYEKCTASFSRSDRLQNHLRTHTGELPFKCQYPKCGKRFANSQHFKRHQSSHESSFKCTIRGCSVVCKRQDALKRHIDTIHYNKNPKQYKCTECDKQFSNHNWLQSHMYKHTGKFPYTCQTAGCGKGFLLPSKLKRHMKTHEGHTCKIPGCGKTFFKWSYATHLKEFHPTVHVCNTCDRPFSHLGNMKAHVEMHKEALSRKIFPCEVPNCPRYYFAQKNLNFHVKVYHKEGPYPRDREHCRKAFKAQVKKSVQTLPKCGSASETASPRIMESSRISELDTIAKAKSSLKILSGSHKFLKPPKKLKKQKLVYKGALNSSRSSIPDGEMRSTQDNTSSNTDAQLLDQKRFKKCMNLEKYVNVLQSNSASSKLGKIRDDHIESGKDLIVHEDDHIVSEDDHIISEDDHIESEDNHIESEDDHIESRQAPVQSGDKGSSYFPVVLYLSKDLESN